MSIHSMGIHSMTEPIESTIIAYFDGKLSDDEGAELLHRVSVSPEIRQIFQEHESIRQLANRAARNTAIPASLEESLFQRIAAMENEEKLPAAFWNIRRISTAAGAVAILLAFLASSIEFSNSGFRNGNSGIVSASSTIEHPASVTAMNVKPIANTIDASTPDINSNPSNRNSSYSNVSRVVHRTMSSASIDRDVSNSISSNSMEPNAIDPNNIEATSESQIALSPAPRGAEIARINMPGAANAPIIRAADLIAADRHSMFELGYSMNSSEFNIPGQVPASTLLLSNFSLRGGINLDDNDQIGAIFSYQTEGSELSPILTYPNGMGYVNATANYVYQPQYAEELYYKRRDPVIVNNALFYVTESILGGTYTSGTVIGAEAGIEVPISSHLLGGVSVIVNRLHQNTQSSYSEPVIFDGTYIYNSLSGSIQYSMSYRF